MGQLPSEDGLNQYTQMVARRYEVIDRLLQGIREGNEYQTLCAVRECSALRMPDGIADELTAWKYDVIQLKALIIQELRRTGVMELLLYRAQAEFMQRTYRASGVEECKRLIEEMALRFCEMNHLKEIHEYSVLVQKVILAVDMDLSQVLTLQSFSESLNVNRSYLSDLFRREVGMTITDYVTERRIQSAADMLLMTRDPVKLVAKRVGIADVHYFSRLFRKRMGKPPTKYREERG